MHCIVASLNANLCEDNKSAENLIAQLTINIAKFLF